MATIATIAAINGTGSVYAVNAQGVQRLLKAGDTLEKGETIRTVGDANVELLSEDMRALHINPDQVVKLDDNVFQTEQTPTTADAAVTTPATTNTVIQALENGQDLSTQLDATAAGLGDGGGGGGASFVQLGRISEGVSGNSYGFDFSGLGVPPVDVGVGQTVTATSTSTSTTTTTTTTPSGVTASITVNPIAGDGVISGAENNGIYKVSTPISGTVGGDAKVGDTVTLTVNGHSYTTTVVVVDGQLAFNTAVPTSDLAADSTVTASITVTNSDGTASSTATADAVVAFDLVAAPVTITIDPVGDDVITPAESKSEQPLTLTGTVTGVDAKVGDVVTIVVNGHEYTGTVAQGNNGLVYSVPGVPASDLVADKSIEASITVTDPYGNTAEGHAVHLVTGSSLLDNSQVSVTEDQLPEQQTEGAAVLSASGSVHLVATTSDGADVLNPSTLKLVSSSDVTEGGSTTTPALGTLNVHADGTYDFSVPNQEVQNLAVGESVVQTYEVKSADGTATSTITVTINGTNDAPTIEGKASGGVVEDSTLSATGTLTSADVDHNATAAWSVVGAGGYGLGHGTYGTLSLDGGNWTYTLDNSNPVVQSLAAGETHTETFTVQVNDGQGGVTPQQISIVVTGTNDAPTIVSSNGNGPNGTDGVNDQVYESGLAIGTIPSATSVLASGTFTIGDVDGLHDIKTIAFTDTGTGGSTLVWQVSDATGGVAGLVGHSFSTSNGTVQINSYDEHGGFGYTYTLTSPTADLAGTETNSFTISVSDGASSSSAVVSIAIVDDTPIGSIQHANAEDFNGSSLSSLLPFNFGADGLGDFSLSSSTALTSHNAAITYDNTHDINGDGINDLVATADGHEVFNLTSHLDTSTAAFDGSFSLNVKDVIDLPYSTTTVSVGSLIVNGNTAATADGTLTLLGSDTIHPSNAGGSPMLGVKDNNMNIGESLTFNFHGTVANNLSLHLFDNAEGYAYTYTATKANGETYTSGVITGSGNGDISAISIDGGYTSLTLTVVSDPLLDNQAKDKFKIGSLTFDHQDPQGVAADFTYAGKDSDGDALSGTLHAAFLPNDPNHELNKILDTTQTHS